MTPVGLGLRAQRGGAVVVGVALDAGSPKVVLSTVLVTGAPDDRVAYEPYHVAAELPRGGNGAIAPEAAQVVAEGRRLQESAAISGLRVIADDLSAAGHEIEVAALLVNRAGWVTDLLEYSLAYADHPPVAEGLAVRDALRAAVRPRFPLAEVDEKDLPAHLAASVGFDQNALDAELKRLDAQAGRPWRREQKAACLAGWLSLLDHGR